MINIFFPLHVFLGVGKSLKGLTLLKCLIGLHIEASCPRLFFDGIIFLTDFIFSVLFPRNLDQLRGLKNVPISSMLSNVLLCNCSW